MEGAKALIQSVMEELRKDKRQGSGNGTGTGLGFEGKALVERAESASQKANTVCW